MGAPLVSIPASDWTFAAKQPINQGFDDCAFPARPGQLFNLPNPALAQTPMAGGAYDTNPLYTAKEWPAGPVDYTYKTDPTRAQVPFAGGKRSRRRRQQRGGGSYNTNPLYTAKEWPQTAHESSRATAWGDPALAETTDMSGGGCGCSASRLFGGSRKRRGTRRMAGGGCPCAAGRPMGGGARRSRRNVRRGSRKQTRRMRGGASNGYAIDPSQSIGGSGPNVDALRTAVPCDPRAGSMNPLNPPPSPPDPRAGGFGYSATPNTTTPSLQAGGAFSTGNGFSDSCYKAPGSELPKYEAQTAGFTFYPSTASGGTLPDGVTAYEDVVPYAARMGGGRRRRAHKRRRSHKRRH